MNVNLWLSGRQSRWLVGQRRRRRYLIVTKVDVGKTALWWSLDAVDTFLFESVNAVLARLRHARRESLAVLAETVKTSAYTSENVARRIWRSVAPLFIPISLLIALCLVVTLCYLGHDADGRAVALLTPAVLRHLVARIPPHARRLMRTEPRMFVTVFALACLVSTGLLCWSGHPEGALPVGRLFLVCVAVTTKCRRT